MSSSTMIQGNYSTKSDTSKSSTASSLQECSSKISKLSRQDPASHRLIEKRRRDRMNSCLADLSQLIPSAYLRKGQSRVEKTEIIELAIRFILTLNSQLKRSQELLGHRSAQTTDGCCQGQFYHGYVTCLSDAIRYLIEMESFSPSDALISNLRNCLHQRSQMLAPELTINSVDSQANPSASTCPNHTPSSQDFDTQAVGASSNPVTNYEAERRQLLQNVTPMHVNEDYGSTTTMSETNSSNGQMIHSPSMPSLDSPQELKHHSMFLHPNTGTNIAAGPPNSFNPGRGFKYKEDMKLRFNADSRRVGVEKPFPGCATSVNSVEGDQCESGPTSSQSYAHDESSQDSILHPPQHPPELKQQVNSTMSECTTSSTSNDTPRFPDNLLPGFVLHLRGTHYIPVFISPELLVPALRTPPDAVTTPSSSSEIYHPISIPVNLTGAHYVLPRKMQKELQALEPPLQDPVRGLLVPPLYTPLETASAFTTNKAPPTVFPPNPLFIHQPEPSPAYILVPTPAAVANSAFSSPTSSTPVNHRGPAIVFPASFHSPLTNQQAALHSNFLPNGFRNIKPVHLHETSAKEEHQ